MTKKIGIMVGRENTWPGAFIEEVNRRNADSWDNAPLNSASAQTSTSSRRSARCSRPSRAPNYRRRRFGNSRSDISSGSKRLRVGKDHCSREAEQTTLHQQLSNEP